MSQSNSHDKKESLSRRSFLKNSSLVGMGLYFVPRHVLGGPGFRAPSDKLIIAGIGAGGRGGSNIREFAATGKAEIGFLCDVDDRQVSENRKNFPKAKYYKDWRELFDKEHKNFDAVCIGTPDHNHAIIAFHAMQLGKHVYVEKPLTHDIWEARMLGEAEKRYKVVTQMGDQGASGDGVRKMKEWYDAGLIGEVHTVHCWTDRPVWPQGLKWPTQKATPPKGLDWDLFLGTAADREYRDMITPFNWRGWWDFGTGAIGDMGCHLIGPAFKVLDLKNPTQVIASVSTPYFDLWKEEYHPESAPIASSSHLVFERENGNPIKLNWMDGGIQPERPDELTPNEMMGDPDGSNGVIFEGTKGKMMCGTYGRDPKLLPTDSTEADSVSEKYKRVKGGEAGHYNQWVEACIAGYGNMEVSSPFADYSVPLTESLLMANLAIRSFNFRKSVKLEDNTEAYREDESYVYPGRGIALQWDAENMKVKNFDEANQFVKREYREGWPDLKF